MVKETGCAPEDAILCNNLHVCYSQCASPVTGLVLGVVPDCQIGGFGRGSPTTQSQ